MRYRRIIGFQILNQATTSRLNSRGPGPDRFLVQLLRSVCTRSRPDETAVAGVSGVGWVGVVRVGGDDGELRTWHHIHVYSIESRLIRRVIYGKPNGGDLCRHTEPRLSAPPPLQRRPLRLSLQSRCAGLTAESRFEGLTARCLRALPRDSSRYRGELVWGIYMRRELN